MKVLLLRPIPRNERYGLGPFFRTEPLGLEYVAAAAEAAGAEARVVDLRFGRPVEHYLRRDRPRVVGIACMHSLEIEDTLALVRRVRAAAPEAFVILGGHSAAAFPAPLLVAGVDALCVGDGEQVVPELMRALAGRGTLSAVPGLLLRDGDGRFTATADAEPVDLDRVPLPARASVGAFRRHYACLQYRPTWLVETARGCPFRCSFCSVWPLYQRSFRMRSIDAVCRDLGAVGPHVFIADDLFWHQADRSRELARELRRRGVRKRWVLVQTRTDLAASHPDLLEEWRSFADQFDIFFGLEAATDACLAGLAKDTTVDRTVDGIRTAREYGYGVTGNFVVDPDWTEADFERLWAFVERERLHRAGYTILTPLPGTSHFETTRPRIRAVEWAQFDMHHLLWEPRLGVERFVDLYCETWRRSVLNLRGEKRWWQWVRQVQPQHLLFLARALRRTQRLMDPRCYLAEHRLATAESGDVVVHAVPATPTSGAAAALPR